MLEAAGMHRVKGLGWRFWANRFVLVTRFPIGVRSYGHADVALGCWPLALARLISKTVSGELHN